jgi:hypothetical protein
MILISVLYQNATSRILEPGPQGLISKWKKFKMISQLLTCTFDIVFSENSPLPVIKSPPAAVDTPMELNSLKSAEISKKRKAKPKKARKNKCLKVDENHEGNRKFLIF